MHGIIHVQLQKFVEGQYGAYGWRELCRRAGLERKIFTAIESYPDEQLLQLVTQAVGMTGVPVTQLLESFGQFLVPTYLSVYGSLVRPEWRTMDLLEHTIHRVVRSRQLGAQPPELKVERVSEVAEAGGRARWRSASMRGRESERGPSVTAASSTLASR